MKSNCVCPSRSDTASISATAAESCSALPAQIASTTRLTGKLERGIAFPGRLAPPGASHRSWEAHSRISR